MSDTGIAIDVERLREMLAEGVPVTVLDVRTGQEREELSIPGSIPVDAYEALANDEPDALSGVDLPGDQPVVAVCAAGRTSLKAALQLRKQGFNAWSLSGGMEAWTSAWNVTTVPTGHEHVTVLQVRRVGKGCLSYVVGAGDEAVVIDAALDATIYVQLARQRGWRITAVVDTHVHADHLSRSRLLAEQTGATLYQPEQNRVSFPFAPLTDGDHVTFGSSQLTAVHTPGHTPESMSYRLDDHVVFTGDTLFLDGVGRPDLEATVEEARARAQLLYDSLQRLLALPGHMLVLPGHTSLRIRFDSESIVLPLDEVERNIGMTTRERESFVSWILGRIPPTPANHSLIVTLNEAGLLPGSIDQMKLEAGANRCAVS